jgi:molybdopterin-containing oxidoreductase family iron-sulfur binding subunit
MVRLGMLIDLKRCIGCDACTVACRQENGTPSNILYARVYRQEIGTYPHTKRVFLPVLCNHCEDPPCLKACPSHAIYKKDDGTVLVDEEKCCGSRACLSACPYGAMFFWEGDGGYFPNATTPYEEFHRRDRYPKTAMKCTFCHHRLGQGLEPACVVTCPTECRIFGDLDDPASKPSRYLKERVPTVTPIPLRPDAKTRPNVLYLP